MGFESPLEKQAMKPLPILVSPIILYVNGLNSILTFSLQWTIEYTSFKSFQIFLGMFGVPSWLPLRDPQKSSYHDNRHFMRSHISTFDYSSQKPPPFWNASENMSHHSYFLSIIDFVNLAHIDLINSANVVLTSQPFTPLVTHPPIWFVSQVVRGQNRVVTASGSWIRHEMLSKVRKYKIWVLSPLIQTQPPPLPFCCHQGCLNPYQLPFCPLSIQNWYFTAQKHWL